MAKTLYIMQGIPASGKSTLAATIARESYGHILSTDEYWMKSDGIYRFNPSKLDAAHRWNKQRCIKLMQAGAPLIVIDNTNITRRDVQPYLVMAEIFEYDVQIVRVQTNLDTCLARNATRNVDRQIPEDIIRRMAARMEDLTNGS
jgi:predicted kinase